MPCTAIHASRTTHHDSLDSKRPMAHLASRHIRRGDGFLQPMTPELAILVPHFQTPALTSLCLRLLRQHTWPRDYETIVIDNGSQDGSGDMLRRMPWLRVL